MRNSSRFVCLCKNYKSFVCENNSAEHLLLMVSNVEEASRENAGGGLAGWLAGRTLGGRERERERERD